MTTVLKQRQSTADGRAGLSVGRGQPTTPTRTPTQVHTHAHTYTGIRPQSTSTFKHVSPLSTERERWKPQNDPEGLGGE